MFVGRTSWISQKHANGHHCLDNNPKKKPGRSFVKGRQAKQRRVVVIASGSARYERTLFLRPYLPAAGGEEDGHLCNRQVGMLHK